MPLAAFADRLPMLTQRLCQARARDRLGHAYLISGDSPQTLEQFVLAWMQVCLCPNSQPDGDACGSCQTCQQVLGRRYHYLYELRPRSKSRAITIDVIRELERALNIKSGGYARVAVIWEADCMQEAAQNAFLKTLEEPHPNTLLLLVSVRPEALLTTIRSRCQSIALRENRFAPGLPELPAIYANLAKLRRNRGAGVAAQVAGYLDSFSEAMKGSSEAKVKKDSSALQKQARDGQMTSAQKQRLETELQAAAAADYLGAREQLLSAIYTWFGQEYLRANGVPISHMPNPEAYEGLPPETCESPISEGEARHNLDQALDFIRTMTFNVDEALAVQNFCQQVCARI
jgi:DNA polymerase III delta prime subunit